MSLLRIPFSLSVIWAVRTSMTAPQPPPQLHERMGPIGPEVYLMPKLIKAFFYLAGLAEISVIMANSCRGNALSERVIAILVHRLSSPDTIRITWPFLIAWICSMSGAMIRRSCYRIMGELFTFEISLRKNHKLVTSGPYAFVRHPSYSSGALALFGALTCHTTPGSWAFECSGVFQPSWTGPVIGMCWLIASILFMFAIVPRLDKEDAMLKERFGTQWDEWAKQVPYKLLPGIY
ncbi:hypothetical protein BDZ97DRAFT_1906203 [Flammula alnicola]|nr:hypothetical protein BDZ97DRAFT_1906203 [Flammula alnicola]